VVLGPAYTEFDLTNLARPLRALHYALQVGALTVPWTAPPFVPEWASWLLWHPTLVGQRGDHNASVTTSPHESWLFINGIMTDDTVAQLNAAYLAHLFHRPVTLIENSTGGVIEDLLECAIDKAALRTGEAATIAFPVVYEALRDPTKTRVVLIAHSQGTIIAGVILRYLHLLRQFGRGQTPRPVGTAEEPLVAGVLGGEPVPVYPDAMPLRLDDFVPPTDAELAKLEIYCFANCATEMPYLIPEQQVPWIESFGNANDVVARLGMLAPHPDRRDIHIDGPRYIRPGGWGHLLNAHYLYDIDRAQRRGRKPGAGGQGADPFRPYLPNDAPDQLDHPLVPRLYGYLNGGSPAPPPSTRSAHSAQSDRPAQNA